MLLAGFGIDDGRVYMHADLDLQYPRLDRGRLAGADLDPLPACGSEFDLKGLDVASAVANGQSDSCKGKFASVRVSELVVSEVVFRGFSSCEDTNELPPSFLWYPPPRRLCRILRNWRRL